MTKKKSNGQTYQELKLELDNILAKLQHPDTDIDEAVALHAQGQEVLERLNSYLQKIADASEISINRLD